VRQLRYVYLDVLTVVNAVMNFIILLLTSWLAQVPARFSRLAGGALLGTAYAVYLVLNPTTRLAGWPAKVGASLAILAATYFPMPAVRFVRVVGYFYLISFTLGGAALAVHYLSQGLVLPTTGPWPGIPWWTLAAGLALAIPLTRLAWTYFKQRRWQDELKATLIVDWRRQQVEVPGILDSGNMLVDPLTGAPVMVVEAQALAAIIPEAIIALVEGGIRGELDLESLGRTLANEPSAVRFRVIPFDSLGQENALLLAFRPDRVQIKYRGQIVSVPQAIVGLSPGYLSPEGGWRALVSPEVLLPYLDEA